MRNTELRRGRVSGRRALVDIVSDGERVRMILDDLMNGSRSGVILLYLCRIHPPSFRDVVLLIFWLSECVILPLFAYPFHYVFFFHYNVDMMV